MPLVVQTHPEELPVSSETFVELRCEGSGNPTPTLTWQKVGSSPLASDPSKYIMLANGNLIITGFNTDTDTGYYICNGTNTQGTAGDYTLGRQAIATFRGFSGELGNIPRMYYHGKNGGDYGDKSSKSHKPITL